MSKKLDWLLLNIPKVAPNAPTLAPALLKAVLVEAGYSAKCIDLNYDFYLNTKDSHQEIWANQTTLFDNDDQFELFYKKHLQGLVNKWAKSIVSQQATWVGLSLLSKKSMGIAEKLSREIKRISPTQKICLGGPPAHFQEIPLLMGGGLICT